MISQNTLHYKIINYLVDHLENGKSIFLRDVLEALNLTEFFISAKEIASILKDKGYINFIPISDQPLIIKLNLEGKYFIEQQLGNNSNLAEIDEIISNTSLYPAVTVQISKAKEYLMSSDIQDHRNSIKEAIGAAESIIKIALKNDSVTLGDGIRQFCSKNSKHKAFIEGISKLYGYNSNVGGVRHGLGVNDEIPSYSEAKFLVVIYSAFVNYVIEELKLVVNQ